MDMCLNRKLVPERSYFCNNSGVWYDNSHNSFGGYYTMITIFILWITYYYHFFCALM